MHSTLFNQNIHQRKCWAKLAQEVKSKYALFQHAYRNACCPVKSPALILFIVSWSFLLGLGGCKQPVFKGGRGGMLINPEFGTNVSPCSYIEPKKSNVSECLVRIANVSIDNKSEGLRVQFSDALAALHSDRPEKQSAAIGTLAQLACKESVIALASLLEDNVENMKWRASPSDIVVDGKPLKLKRRVIYEPLAHLAVKALGSLEISDLLKVDEFSRVTDEDIGHWRKWWALNRSLFEAAGNEVKPLGR